MLTADRKIPLCGISPLDQIVSTHRYKTLQLNLSAVDPDCESSFDKPNYIGQ